MSSSSLMLIATVITVSCWAAARSMERPAVNAATSAAALGAKTIMINPIG